MTGNVNCASSVAGLLADLAGAEEGVLLGYGVLNIASS